MNDEAKVLAHKLHADALAKFKIYMGSNKPALEKYYANCVREQVVSVLENIAHVYPSNSKSAEFMRLTKLHVKQL